MSRQNFSIKTIDWWTVAIYLGLAIFGWVLVYSTGYDPDAPTTIIDISTRAGKQGMYILLAMLVAAVLMLIDPRIFKTFSYPLYGISIALLLFVMVYGGLTKGATSWFELPGGFKFQPSELAKFTTGLALATYLSNNEASLKNWRKAATAIGIFMLPAILVVAQGDPGTALVYTAMMVPLFREGLNAWLYVFGLSMATLLISSLVASPIFISWLLMGLLALLLAVTQMKNTVVWFLLILLVAVLGGLYYTEFTIYALAGMGGVLVLMLATLVLQKKAGLAIGLLLGLAVASGLSFSVSYLFNNILQPHQQDRINVWLKPEQADKRGSYYNLRQSKLAIGSGRLHGKGLLNGEMTQGNHVPEQHTDFIFTVAGEEQGFWGTFIVICLYVMLLIRLSVLAERQRSRFTRIYAYGIAGIFSVHVLVNIGMTMGLMPVIGIPLPLMSYGGSSLVSFTIMLAVLLRFDSQRLLVFR